MQEVKLYMNKDRQLYVRTKDGLDLEVNIFSGGGYYDAILLQTKEEREEIARARKENEDKFFAERAEARKKHSQKLSQRLLRSITLTRD